MRLAAGRVPGEGRVEVRLGEDGEGWGGVCGAGWGAREAGVVCRQLGLGYAGAVLEFPRGEAGGRGLVVSGVECRGEEAELAGCTAHSSPACPDSAGLAGVLCTGSPVQCFTAYTWPAVKYYNED